MYVGTIQRGWGIGLLSLLFVTSCAKSGDQPCVPGIVVAPVLDDNSILTMSANTNQVITASVEQCSQLAQDVYTFSWFTDGNGDGVLDPTAIAQTPDWTATFCSNEIGLHPVKVVATQVLPEAELQPPITFELTFNMDVVTTIVPPATPTCVADALTTIKTQINEVSSLDTDVLATLNNAKTCLDAYLATNLCDVEASYAAGLADLTLFLAQFPQRFDERGSLTVEEVQTIIDQEVAPMVHRFEVVDQKASTQFQFFVDGKFQIEAFRDLSYLPGDETVLLILQGEHDLGEVRAIRAVASYIRGFSEMLLAYTGLAQFILDIPRLDEVNYDYFRKQLIGKIIDDQTFLTIDQVSIPSGRSRLLTSRGAFMDATTHFRRAVEFIAQETDNQQDDLLRYWDCGADGICDCSNTTNIVFLDCPNDADAYEGADSGEDNGKYDKGEPVGSDRVGTPNFSTADLPSNLNAFLKQLTLLQENLAGPNALDLNEFTDAPVELFLDVLLLPTPEIRLSQWFLTPSNPRDLVPLYSIATRSVIFDTENEPFSDVGFDGIATADEYTVHWPNPRDVTLETVYDPLLNPDPHFDDFDPFCNPVCNSSDNLDNDADGLKDQQDRISFNSQRFSQDFGVENNLIFDFLDFNGNFSHDNEEPSEPFEDVGVIDYTGKTIGANNGRWDFADRAHPFPQGADVGPFPNLDIVDPANGIASTLAQPGDRDVRALVRSSLAGSSAIEYNGLFDPYYFFFPDPTFSGVLRFPEEIIGLDNTPLTDNAKVIRFFSKFVELAAIVDIAEFADEGEGVRAGDGASTGVIDGNAHLCADQAKCLQAIEVLQQP